MNKHGDPHIILINNMSQTHYKWNNILKYLFLKFTKKVHITTHLLFRFFVSSSLWGSRAQLGIGEMRGALILGIRWEEMWLWRRSSCSLRSFVHHVCVNGYEEEEVRVQNFILGLRIQSCRCCCPVRMMLMISESCETHVRFKQ